jgi:carboxyl-terminal processing protease
MVEAAAERMLQALDPLSAYLGSKAFRDMQAEAEGRIGGIGVEVAMEAGAGALTIVSAIDDGPAAKAGLMAGDAITDVNGARIAALTRDRAIERLRGPVNAPVTLTIVRRGKATPFYLRLLRGVIPVNDVKAQLLGDILYIRVPSFNAHAHVGLVKQVDALKQRLGRPPRGYIVDLRNNAGGLLEQAVNVADAFLDKGAIVLTKGRVAEETARTNAKPGDIAEGKPLVVLVDGASAYASEIVAGALQDHRRAIVVGTRSFGRGIFQTVVPFGSEGGALRLTTARHYTPSGARIDGKGIEPDVVVEQKLPTELWGTGSSSYVPRDSDRDAQLQYALKMLRGEPLLPLGR